MSSRAGAAGPLIVMAAGLVLAGAVSASWVTRTVTHDVGGVPITEQVSRAGSEFAGRALAVGVAALLLGLLALLLPQARRILGSLLYVVSIPTGGILAWGVTLARRTDGTLTPAPALAMAACALLFAGAMVMRRRASSPAPLLDERYTVEGGEPEDEEWRLAADEAGPGEAAGPDGPEGSA